MWITYWNMISQRRICELIWDLWKMASECWICELHIGIWCPNVRYVNWYDMWIDMTSECWICELHISKPPVTCRVCIPHLWFVGAFYSGKNRLSYQDGYRSVTMTTHSFIVLLHKKTRLVAPFLISHTVTLSWHWTNILWILILSMPRIRISSDKYQFYKFDLAWI